LPLQRGVTRWLAGNTLMLGRLAGILMLAIAAFGLWIELLPNFSS
jgi:hypothetical protein